jgi:hypothetical protein
MNIPSYYNLFEVPNRGDGTVRVHFTPKSGCNHDWLPYYNFPWCEILRIFDPETNSPYEIMQFDDGVWRVDEYKISVSKKSMVIMVGEVIPTDD